MSLISFFLIFFNLFHLFQYTISVFLDVHICWKHCVNIIVLEGFQVCFTINQCHGIHAKHNWKPPRTIMFTQCSQHIWTFKNTEMVYWKRWKRLKKIRKKEIRLTFFSATIQLFSLINCQIGLPLLNEVFCVVTYVRFHPYLQCTSDPRPHSQN